MDTTEYLRRIIENNTIKADLAKVFIVMDWLQPKDIKQFQSFLSVSNY